MTVTPSPSARSGSRSTGSPAKLTGTMALVRGPMLAAAAAASMFHVAESMSTKRGCAPRYTPQFVDAAKVMGEEAISSPGSMPAANAAACSAAVPDENATQWRAPTRSAIARSKRSIVGPCVMNGSRSAAATAATSASVISWRA